MTGYSWGGVVNNTSMYHGGAYIYSPGIGVPTCRLAANGNRPIRIHSVALGYVTNGYAAFDYGAGASTDAYYSNSGGSGTILAIRTGGTMYVGRNTAAGGASYWDDGGSLSGLMPGSFQYAEVPSAPQTPGATPGVAAGSANLTWAAPASNGDSAITGYKIEWATDAGFTTGVGSKTVGAVTSDTVTGLTPGATYYFRVYAINAVATAAGTTSVASSSVSALLGSVPDAPTALTILAKPGAFGCSWTAPAFTGGLPITSYELQVATDSGFASIVANLTGITALAKSVVGLAPATLHYARVRAVNSLGPGAWSTVASASTSARGALDIVQGAALHLSDGVQIEVRSDGANPAVLTLGYIALGTAATFNAIATLPVGATSSDFAAPGGPRNLALAADPAGNVFVIGRRGDSEATVLVHRYARLTALSWSGTPTALSGALPSTGDPLTGFAAAYAPGTGGSPVPSILLVARRAGSAGAGAVSYGTIDPAAVASALGSLFLASGSDPGFLGTPPSSSALDTGAVDVQPLVPNGTRLAVLANGWAVVDVVNGAVTGVSKAANGTLIAGPWARVLGVSSTTFVVLSVSGGALAWSFYSATGTLLGSGSYAGANAQGGAFAGQWDAYYDRVAAVVTVYYVADNAGARQLESVDVSASLYTAGTPVVLTAALGAASSTNAEVRTPHGIADERRILVAAANLLTGAKSTAAYVDTSGNVAPNAPSLTLIDGFDASQARTLLWAFSDPNGADAQTAYELQIQRASDSVNVVATGKVASAALSYPLAAATLTNGINYRWRARTWDELDTAGAWSAYDDFTTAALGTLTITNPAADNPVGLDVATLLLTWSYVQTDGYVQTQRRVRVIRVSDSAVLSDTTMQASTATSFTVAVPTDEPVRIELSIITNAPGTPTVTANRLLTSSYASPMAPTLTLIPEASYITVIVTNPAPTGDKPEVATNLIERRPSGSTEEWTPIAEVGYGGSYNDHAVRSATAYDYRATGRTA